MATPIATTYNYKLTPPPTTARTNHHPTAPSPSYRSKPNPQSPPYLKQYAAFHNDVSSVSL
ncbi:hypothetical protein [Helicobacter suis]|uniref:hypothetical protein n=1 Tax=Helicobacter suis TaxID=104628 RepID=UPI0015969134|nr:hypothetical protein [Helicobacter suis]